MENFPGECAGGCGELDGSFTGRAGPGVPEPGGKDVLMGMGRLCCE